MAKPEIPAYGDLISTVDQKGKRKWIYALKPDGRLYRLRKWLSLFYIVLFFSLPFIKTQGGLPLFQFDIPHATFILFGKVFLPQDFLILGTAMIVGMVFVVLFTLIFGRIFCGWICPQTIFMEMVFRRLEYWIEGPANKQAVADRKKWGTELWVRKIVKHVLFFLLSFLIANTFLAYIVGIDELWLIIKEPASKHWVGLIALIGFTIAFYIVYAFVREIVCTVVCPYGRLQSVLLDKSSLVVAYDHRRGEPRSQKRKSNDGSPVGDCIDCGLCVNVCPTGIDIRNGLQLECVNCTACIDACDKMMAKVGREPRLIKIASEADIAQGRKVKLNYRSKLLSGVSVALLVVLCWLIGSRSLFDATVLRVPGQILQENEDGTISNLYRIKIVSKSMKTEPYRLELDNGHEAKIVFVGKQLDSLKSGKPSEETFFIKIPANKITKRKESLKLSVMSGDRVVQAHSITFIGTY